MTSRSIVWLGCFTMLTANGCVMKSTYDAVVQEGESTKSELDRAREEQKLLSRQVNQIERSNAESMREAETATAALQQAKDDAERQRQLSEDQLARLKQKVSQLNKQQGALQYELTVAKENSAALQELVEVYQKKLRDGAATGPASSSALEPPIPKPFDPASIPLPQELPTPTPAPSVEASKPAAAAPGTPTPSSKPVAEAKDAGWFSGIKEWIISLWRSVFS